MAVLRRCGRQFWVPYRTLSTATVTKEHYLGTKYSRWKSTESFYTLNTLEITQNGNREAEIWSLVQMAHQRRYMAIWVTTWSPT